MGLAADLQNVNFSDHGPDSQGFCVHVKAVEEMLSQMAPFH